ncbi:MAG: threonylcarbamoyl-AMP synthase [Ruminococcaceae bacterium]|nr:threonylcarbamoyl-AMP synthase [Oscillospiraceae bacterium]
MNTERLNINTLNYNETVDRAADILRQGGIVAIPTETVYGLAASAYDTAALKKVFIAKGRPQDNPLIVHISDIEMLDEVAVNIPPEAYECAHLFWPGPFTMILERSQNIAKEVSAGLDTVAVRMPSDKVARDIIRASGPLAAPSANTSGSPSPTSAQHVIDDLDGKIDAVVVSGECEVGVESTVVTLVTNPVRLLRPGAVTAEQLCDIFPNLLIDNAVLANPQADEKVASPGMKYKHYAPKTETYLVEASSEDYIDFVNDINNCVAVCFEEELPKINCPKLSYGSVFDEASLAHRVFEVLRMVDELHAEKVYIHAPSKSGIGLAVYNRLIRAAAFRVVSL